MAEAPDAAARAAVARLDGWSGLTSSRRLHALLAYLAAETLAGRGAALQAKTIALDHYGYAPDDLPDRESVVRVDMGRLRRRLADYYAGEGADDPVQVTLPKGSYALRFETADEAAPPQAEGVPADPPKRSRSGAIAILIACVLAAGLALGWFWRGGPEAADETAERSAVFEASPLRLQATNLAENGRDLIFPAAEPARLRAALVAFEAAVETDPAYFGGHAGAAQVLGMLALLNPDPEAAAKALEGAKASAAKAQELAPGDPWSQSARAWVAFADGDADSALTLSDRAVSLSPDDPHLIEFDSLIALFSGEFDRTIREVERILKTLPEDEGFVFMNASGSARFHTGDDAGTIAAFEEAVARGGPVGPFTLSYLMAAHQRLGNTTRAGELARQFNEGWPGYPMDALLLRLFTDPAHAEELTEAMKAAGWSR